MNNSITIGLNEDLIKKLAALLIEASNGSPDLSRNLCVFSNRRASLFLIKELSKQLGSSYFPPKIVTDDDLVDDIVRSKTDFRNMPFQESQYIIYTLAKKFAPSLVKKKPSLPQFFPWAREIASFIDQLDMEAIDSGSLSSLESHAKIGLSVPDSVNRLLENIGRIREQLHAEMEKRKQYSRGYVYLKASEVFEENDLKAYDNIFICNFFYMQETEKKIFKKLLGSGRARFVFQGDQDKWPTLKENAAEFGMDIKPMHSKEISDAAPAVDLYAASDTHTEAAVVRELLDKERSSGPDAVIVIPREESLLPVIAEVSDSIGDFNISVGYRLARSSVYHLILSIFKAQSSRRENGHYYSKDYLEVLMHPVAKNWEEVMVSRDNRILVHGVETSLKGMDETDISGSFFVSLDDVENDKRLIDAASLESGAKSNKSEIKKALGAVHDTFFRNWEKISTLSQLASSIEFFLDGVVKLGLLKSHPMNYAVADRLYDICDEIRGSSFAEEEFSKEDLLRIFDEIMSSEKVSFMGTPLKGVQLLGLFQTHSISFDNVIILDANEGLLPKSRVSEPLIPREAMLLAGLRRHEKSEEIERYQFKRLLSSSKKAHIIYRSDDRSERSRFVEELLLEQERKRAEANIFTASFGINPIPARSPIKKTKQQSDFLKKFEYSPTSVNTYLTCPAQFYFAYVLRLREQDDKLEQIEGRDIGTFVHELLEEAYTPFKGKRPVPDGKFEEMLLSMLERKFRTGIARRIRSGDFMLRETLRVSVQRFLACERGRDVERILELEKRYKTKMTVDGTEIIMKGTVDRIDRMASGEIMVLDYKTGSSDIKPSTRADVVLNASGGRRTIKKKIKSLQLPIYVSLVLGEYGLEKVNPALYSIKDSQLTALWEDKHDETQKKELYLGYMAALDHILSEIIDPSKDFEPDDSDDRICSGCPYAMMCR